MLESSRQIFSLEKTLYNFVDCQQTNDKGQLSNSQQANRSDAKGQQPNDQQANGLKNDLTNGTDDAIRARARARQVKVAKFQTRKKTLE